MSSLAFNSKDYLAANDSNHKQQVYKFGGSSLATYRCYKKVARLIEKKLTTDDWVVVSASGQTTDWLYQLCEPSEDAHLILSKVQHHQVALIEGCLSGSFKDSLLEQLNQDIERLKHLIIKQYQSALSNDIIAYGEVWSARLLCAQLEQDDFSASWLDARQFLKVLSHSQATQVDIERSLHHLALNKRARQQRLTIVTGFIASDAEGATVLLGRNGSDYSATLLGQLLDADQVTIWTDVAGIYQFDPNLYNEANTINQLPQVLASELARQGSPVLHKKTLDPLQDANSQLCVRSTFVPEQSGTKVVNLESTSNEAIITHKNELINYTLQLSNDLEAQRFIKHCQDYSNLHGCKYFQIFRDGANHTQLELFIAKEDEDFWKDYLTFRSQTIENIKTCASLSIISEDINNKPYHRHFFSEHLKQTEYTYKLYSTAHAHVAIIDSPSIDKLATHSYQAWSKYCSHIAIFLLGTGNVGATWQDLFKQLKPQQPELSKALLVFQANSKKITLIDEKGQAFEEQQNYAKQLKSLVNNAPFEHKVVIDATANEDISDLYEHWLNNKNHIVCANKISSSSTQNNYKKLLKAASDNQVLWQQNATIGAGLPINYALNDLTNSGNNIQQIRGVFSGTLSWLLSTFDEGNSFFELLQKAKELGYTEPDPRLDLSGTDVARKLVIAARIAGFNLDLNDIDVQPLVPQHFLLGSTDYFNEKRNDIDHWFKEQWQEAQQQDKVLVYEAKFIPNQTAYTRLVLRDSSDALVQLSPCDNIFEITTQWYQENPLIIRGPGAGKEVTAAAVQSDLNQVIGHATRQGGKH
ncbi:bifunctional aspartate kinase/homoserine dehydrogenase II [Pleionea sp. CnH1-48]|uniref:bifunctional aspartate kinase/homoserine dehydrogenase II n=1 Tax=Pleionea sp. CnH1-48 TaxID=2954494 RepID=UPI002097BE8C|nr:bifunctional aspartate kinase/homoserine dehydrogenase II [Pleionea sp. CnH1-48]MCO7224423.1 bifunctional aspartate kinase/homoserine dehydrogenase II [Pleionea sp. CnH1-48]